MARRARQVRFLLFQLPTVVWLHAILRRYVFISRRICQIALNVKLLAYLYHQSAYVCRPLTYIYPPNLTYNNRRPNTQSNPTLLQFQGRTRMVVPKTTNPTPNRGPYVHLSLAQLPTLRGQERIRREEERD